MKFKSKFSKFNYILVVIPSIILLILGVFDKNEIFEVIINALRIFFFLTLLFLALYFTTYYEIQNEILVISMCFYKTKIKISDIKTIKHSNSIVKTNFYKPSFDYKGIEIKYNKYDDIFISPEKNDQFIAKLQEINSNIEILK